MDAPGRLREVTFQQYVPHAATKLGPSHVSWCNGTDDHCRHVGKNWVWTLREKCVYRGRCFRDSEISVASQQACTSRTFASGGAN